MRYRSFWRPLDRAELPLLKVVERVRLGGSVEAATRVLTKAGEHGAVWYALAGLAAAVDRRRREQWLIAGGEVAGVYALNIAVKVAAGRRRPPLAELGTPTALSFPSAHTSTSFAAARLYGELAPAVRPALYALAAAMAASRLHFLVHYPSDLVAGAALGDTVARTIPKPAQIPTHLSDQG